MRVLLRSSNFINSFWNVLDVVVFPVVFLALTPFFIREMGEQEFGLWMLINSVLVSFQLLNFGLGTATQRNVARFLGKGDREQMHLSINTNFSMALLLMVLCLLIGLALSFSVKQWNLFRLDEAIRGKAALLMIMASFLVSLKFIEQIFQYSLKGIENFKTPARINLAVRFTTLFGNLILVILGYSLIEMMISQICICLMFLFVYHFFIQRHFPGFRLFLHWERKNMLDELRYGIHTWVQSVAVIMTYQMDRFIVASFFGLAALSYYSIVATMFNHIHMSLNALVPWMLPKVARLREKGKEVISLFLSARSFLLLFGIPMLLIFYWLSEPLFLLWLGDEMYGEIAGYLRLFVLFELFFLFTSAPYYFLNANGKEKLMTRITLINTGITLLSMFTGIFLFDSIEGMIYGLITGTILSILIENLLINREVLQKSFWKEGPLLLFPSALASLMVYFNQPLASMIILPVLLLCAYWLFVRSGEFNLKVLLFG